MTNNLLRIVASSIVKPIEFVREYLIKEWMGEHYHLFKEIKSRENPYNSASAQSEI